MPKDTAGSVIPLRAMLDSEPNMAATMDNLAITDSTLGETESWDMECDLGALVARGHQNVRPPPPPQPDIGP
jgi:hypothetical protein